MISIEETNEVSSEHNHTIPSTPKSEYEQVEINIDEESTNSVSIIRKAPSLFKRCVAEGVGTAIFIFIALATVNQEGLYALSGLYKASQLVIAIGFAIGLSAGVYISGPISGGHLNPAISFSMCLHKKLPWVDMSLYILSQMVGGFIGSLIVFCIYYDAITSFPYTEATAGFFGTIKSAQTTIFLGFIEQILGTAILLFSILLIVNERPRKINAFLIGGVLGALALFLGSNGFAFNMARDLSPRMMSAMFWGVDVFSYGENWWWVPVVGSFIGAPLGQSIYSLYIKFFEE